MASSSKVRDRFEGRVIDLMANFATHLDAFGSDAGFSGPSWYFHQKTIETRRRLGLSGVLGDDDWFDDLYATLTAWGMHRMGPGGAKLGEIGDIKAGIRQQANALQQLDGIRITTLPYDRIQLVGNQLWSLVADLKVSTSGARIVANSKTLHHLLPDLVPPIDRQYTFNFFYSRTMLSVDEETAFLEMFAQLHRIARSSAGVINERLGLGWNTSESKVVDNAIIGYVRSWRPKQGLATATPGRGSSGGLTERESKYDPLGRYLRTLTGDRVELTFRDIEAIIAVPLPPSCRVHAPQFWANSYSGGPWTRQWLDAGWRVSSHSVSGERVVFRRVTKARD